MTTRALDEQEAILNIDAISYATAVGHAAAQRLAQVMGIDAAHCWFNGGYELPSSDDIEAAVQQLGAYTSTRADAPLAEQLYRKGHELKAHAMDVNGWAGQPLWLQVAYRVFANSVFAAHTEIAKAQDKARREEEAARQRAAGAKKVLAVAAEDTAMEQHPDAMERIRGTIAKVDRAMETVAGLIEQIDQSEAVRPLAAEEAAAATPHPVETAAGAKVEGAADATALASTDAKAKARKA